MERTVSIDGREVRLRASAAIPRLYRLKFRRDIIQDMITIQRAMENSVKKLSKSDTAEKDGSTKQDVKEIIVSSMPLETLTLFENMAYLMARHADPDAVPDSVDAWIDGFETFSIYQIFPVIRDMWEANLHTTSTPKKKSRRRKGR